jgi:preprotein translocase subunit SecE
VKEADQKAKKPKTSTNTTTTRPGAGKRTKGGRRQEKALVRYFRQTWAELKKVRWPNRRELTNLSLIVLAVTAAMSAFLGIVDRLSSLLFSFLIDVTG